jgi:PTH1 family peptidyl-tRNA hydrolase
MFNYFRRVFGFAKNSDSENTQEHSKSSPGQIEDVDMKKFLIVGLGNIGPKYHNTRHNIGFKTLDYLVNKEDLVWETAKLGDIARHKVKGRSFLLLKPSTYMNLSGKAVKYWLDKEKITIENLLVVTDDLNLPFGSIRVKMKGSDGGHNGLKDIQNVLQTTKYNRFRFGISDEFSKGSQIDYVLGDWTSEEEKQLPERLEISKKIIESFGLAGINITMNSYNGK